MLFHKPALCRQDSIQYNRVGEKAFSQYISQTKPYTHTHKHTLMHTLFSSHHPPLLGKERTVIPGKQYEMRLLETTGALPASSHSIMWNGQMDVKIGQWSAGRKYIYIHYILNLEFKLKHACT